MIRPLPLLLLLACAPDDERAPRDEDEASAPPDAPGPWAVGTDTAEIELSSGEASTVQFWFPRSAAEGEAHLYGGLVAGGALDGGEADCSQPRPVLLFSHGNGGMRWQSYFLGEHLASHGWLVVAPDHTGNTVFDLDEERQTELVFRRPDDVRRAFDRLVERGLAEGDRLRGCVDAQDGYAMAGHSFGGYTTMAVAGAFIDPEQTAAWCAENGGWLCADVAAEAAANPAVERFELGDARAWAAVPMAPAGHEALLAGLPEVAVPSLVIGGSRDSLTTWSGEVYPIYADLRVEPRAAAQVEDAGHYSFSNACELLPTFADCSPPYREPAEVHALTRTLVLAWLRAARGEEAAWAWLPGEAEGLAWEAVGGR